MSNRITVEAVKEAMERTGLKLTCGKFDDGDCGCPQWLLYVAAGQPADLFDWMNAKYGEDYHGDFRRGYDWCKPGDTQGSQDGYTVRMALLPPGKEGE